MTVPDRRTAAALLLELDPPDWLIRHARAVAEVAGWLAAQIEARGVAIDRRLVESAALLHDVDKALPPADPIRALPHGEGSAAWLTGRGYAELGPAVAGHPVTRLQDSVWFRRWSASASLEDRIVAYADKRAGARLESMDARFASWRVRYPGGWDGTIATEVRQRAGSLEAEVCAVAGTRPDAIRRLRWTGPALGLARATRSGSAAR